jgi:hypothetical protein
VPTPSPAAAARLAAFATLVAAWLLAAAPAAASLTLSYDFDSLVAEADGIVHARVVGQRSEWAEERIVTRVDLQVIECLEGPWAAGEVVTIERLGGAVGNLAMRVPGTAEFLDGEEVVVFLRAVGEARPPMVLGMAQGKFTVVADPVVATPMVTRSLDGLGIVDPDDLQVTEPIADVDLRSPRLSDVLVNARGTGEPVAIPLETFLQEIRLTLGRETP